MPDTTAAPAGALKRIDIASSQFMANGKKYIIETGFSIDRYIMKEELEMELGFGANFQELMKAFEDIYGMANELRFADIVVLAYNKVKGIEKFSQREPVILKLCALFCNEENENRGIITEDMVTAKINDWKAEGLDIADFFRLALHTIPSFIESYRKSTGMSSGSDQQS